MVTKQTSPFSDKGSIDAAARENRARSGNTRVISPLADKVKMDRSGRARWVRARQQSYVNGVLLEPGQTTTWPMGVKKLDNNLEEVDSAGKSIQTADKELSETHPAHSKNRGGGEDFDPYEDLHPDDRALVEGAQEGGSDEHIDGPELLPVQSGNDPRPQDRSLQELVDEGDDPATREPTTDDKRAAKDRKGQRVNPRG